jgi:hypothetical protein
VDLASGVVPLDVEFYTEKICIELLRLTGSSHKVMEEARDS